MLDGIYFAEKNIIDGQEYFASNIKSMVQNYNEPLFDLLDSTNSTIFLEPMLFAYLNDNEKIYPLEQLLLGYIEPKRIPKEITVVSNSKGQIYLPNIGCLKTNIKSQKKVRLFSDKNKFEVFNNGHKENFILMLNYKIANTKIELQLFNNLYLRKHLRCFGFSSYEEINTVGFKNYLSPINESIELIHLHFPSFYQFLNLTTRWIVPFENSRSNSFASMDFHGVGFLNMKKTNSVIFCVEDIIHQCGHLIFSALTYKPNEFFNVNPNLLLRDFAVNHDKFDDRSLYVTLHGVFTEGLMCEMFQTILNKDLFEGSENHELKGRFTYILMRFVLDMESLNQENIFSEKGLVIYKALQNSMYKIYKTHGYLLKEYNITNQPYNFEYDRFLKKNPLE